MCCGDRSGREAGWGLMGQVIRDLGVRGRAVAPESNASSRSSLGDSDGRYRLESSVAPQLSCSAWPGWVREVQQLCPESG